MASTSINAKSKQQNTLETANFVPLLSKRRWFVLAGYCLLTMSNLSVVFAFSSISNIIRRYYSIDMLQVSWLASIYSVVPIVVMFPASHFLNRKGLGLTITLAAFFNALGSCIRYIGQFSISYGYLFLVIGSIICSISISGFLFLPPKIAALWFGERERATAVAIALSADSVGLALGYFLPTAMVKNRPRKSEIGKDLQLYLLITAIQAVLSLIYVAVTVQDAPKTAPSHSEAKRCARNASSEGRNTKNSQVDEVTPDSNLIPMTEFSSQVPTNKQTTKKKSGFSSLLKNLQFHKILHLHGIIFGLGFVFFIALNEMLIPQFPGHEFEVGIMGTLGLLLSVPSTYIIGVLIDKTRAYKRITIGTTCLLTLLTSLLAVFFYMRFSFYSLFFTYIFIVMLSSTYLAIAFDHIAELTYPVSEGHSGALLLWFAQVYSLAFGRAGSYILLHLGVNNLMICILSLTFLALLISFIIKDKGPRSVFTG